MKANELLKRYAAGERDFRGVDLSWSDLAWANLPGVILRGANLHKANLRVANLRGANLIETNLCGADLSWADLHKANIRGAKLHGVNLRRTDLTGANLDYASWPLWCGSLDVKVDERIAAQFAYHLLRMCDYSGLDTSDVRRLAEKFSRFEECECGGWPCGS